MIWEKQRAWNKMERATQNQSAKATLTTCCKMLGLQTNVELLDVTENDRFILQFTQDAEKPDFGQSMIKLETLMRQVLGVVVDLRLEAKDDRNKRVERTGRGK